MIFKRSFRQGTQNAFEFNEISAKIYILRVEKQKVVTQNGYKCELASVSQSSICNLRNISRLRVFIAI